VALKRAIGDEWGVDGDHFSGAGALERGEGVKTKISTRGAINAYSSNMSIRY